MRKIILLSFFLLFISALTIPTIVELRTLQRIENTLLKNDFKMVTSGKFRAQHLDITKFEIELGKKLQLWHELDSYDLTVEYGFWQFKKRIHLDVSSSEPTINNPQVPPTNEQIRNKPKDPWVEIQLR